MNPADVELFMIQKAKELAADTGDNFTAVSFSVTIYKGEISKQEWAFYNDLTKKNWYAPDFNTARESCLTASNRGAEYLAKLARISELNREAQQLSAECGL